LLRRITSVDRRQYYEIAAQPEASDESLLGGDRTTMRSKHPQLQRHRGFGAEDSMRWKVRTRRC
jgi:hypothetical protein